MNRGFAIFGLGDNRARLWALAALATVFLAILRTQFCFVIVEGESMAPTLRNGDLLLVRRAVKSEPKRGDIILGRLGRELVVKRVVGLPGEEVEVLHGSLFIDRKPMPEPYVHPGALSVVRGKLRANHFAVMGDNRTLAATVAMQGVVSKQAIMGRVVFPRLPGCSRGNFEVWSGAMFSNLLVSRNGMPGKRLRALDTSSSLSVGKGRDG
jgi:signal peptidase I